MVKVWLGLRKDHVWLKIPSYVATNSCGKHRDSFYKPCFVSTNTAQQQLRCQATTIPSCWWVKLSSCACADNLNYVTLIAIVENVDGTYKFNKSSFCGNLQCQRVILETWLAAMVHMVNSAFSLNAFITTVTVVISCSQFCFHRNTAKEQRTSPPLNNWEKCILKMETKKFLCSGCWWFHPLPAEFFFFYVIISFHFFPVRYFLWIHYGQ